MDSLKEKIVDLQSNNKYLLTALSEIETELSELKQEKEETSNFLFSFLSPPLLPFHLPLLLTPLPPQKKGETPLETRVRSVSTVIAEAHFQKSTGYLCSWSLEFASCVGYSNEELDTRAHFDDLFELTGFFFFLFFIFYFCLFFLRGIIFFVRFLLLTFSFLSSDPNGWDSLLQQQMPVFILFFFSPFFISF